MNKHGSVDGHNNRSFALRYKKRRKANKTAKKARKVNRAK